MLNLAMLSNSTTDVSVVKTSKLSDKQLEQFRLAVIEASKDEFVGDSININGASKQKIIDWIKDSTTALAILNGDDLVGFFLNRRVMNIKGVNYYRSGMPYVTKANRARGYAKKALSAYFENHRPGMAWIDDTNAASIATYKSIGFKKDKEKSHEKDGVTYYGHWYVLK